MNPVQLKDVKIGDVVYNQTGKEVGLVFCSTPQDIKIQFDNGKIWRFYAARISRRFSLPIDPNLKRLLPPSTTSLRVLR